MTFFDTPIISYTLKLNPPQPSALWELPESVLETVCLPANKNNAMFIGEPPTHNRYEKVVTGNNFIARPHHDRGKCWKEDSEIIYTSNRFSTGVHNQSVLYSNNGNLRNPSRNEPVGVNGHDRPQSQLTYRSRNRTDIPYHLLAQMGLVKPSDEQQPFPTAPELHEELNRRPCESGQLFNVVTATKNPEKLIVNDDPPEKCQESQSSLSQLFLSEELSEQNIGSSVSNVHNEISLQPSGDGNDIPYHLLVQMGLVNTRKESLSKKRHQGKENDDIAEESRIYEINRNFLKNPKASDRNWKPCESDKRFKVCTITQNQEELIGDDDPTKKYKESQSSLSQLFLSEELSEQNIGSSNLKPSDVKAHDRITTQPNNPGGDTNDIPYHLLVQMGLAKPIDEPVDTCKRQLENNNNVPGKRKLVNRSNGNVFNNAIPGNRFLTAAELYAERNRVPRESEEGLNECTPLQNQKQLRLTEFQYRPFQEIESSPSLGEMAGENISVIHNLDTTKYKKDKIVELEMSDMPIIERGSKEDKILQIETNSQPRSGIPEKNSANLESQSSLTQLFQSQEFDEGHYRDIMSCYGSSLKPTGNESNKTPIDLEHYLKNDGVQDDSDRDQDATDFGQNDTDGGQNEPDDGDKLPGDGIVGFEVTVVEASRNVQPFVIRGCEPKMFDTSIKRKEDMPWKSEVHQGVIEPTEEVSNRGKQEMEEIPMVVSPYFPNECNHPVQDDKRTSLYDCSGYQNPQIVSLSQDDTSKDIFNKVFEHEKTEELKLCKDFFKQSSKFKTETKKTKKKKDYTESRKITSYFPVIKNPVQEQGIQPKGSASCTKPTFVKTGQAKEVPVSNIHRDSDGNRTEPKKRKSCDLKLEESSNISKISTPSSKRNRYERGICEDEASLGSGEFEDFGAGCIQYKMPSKHVFLDLPPGSVQFMSQLKPVGFGGKRSETTEAAVSSGSSKKVEVSSKQRKLFDFRRDANENINGREMRILVEEKVEETALEMESSGDLFEIGFTLCYKEKYSVLNRPEGVERKLHHPAGVMSRVEFNGGKIIRIYQDVDELSKENSRSLLLCLLESKCRKVCFEAQAFLLFILEVLTEDDDRTCYEWLLLDPIVGMWLLNPDYPPHSFNCVMKELNVKVESCTERQSTGWKDTISVYMDAQSKVIEKLHANLSQCNLLDVFYHMETPLTPILASMERRSIEVNFELLKDTSKVLQEKLNSIEKSAWGLVGKKFQLSSPPQLRTILYDELKLDEISAVKVKCTANSGAKSTDEGTLKLLLGAHPLPALILEYRHVHKIKSTYIDGILAHVVNKTSVSTTWEQCAAATGRITSSSPNLQSVPKQEDNSMIKGERFNVRKIFVSRPKHTFVAVDFHQIELRVFAHLSQDESLISALKESGDIFQTMTKIRIGKCDFEPSEREKTKTLMYALLYGAGANKISELLSVDMEHAVQICSNFYASFPGLKYFRARILQECRERKELRSLSGRRRLFPNISSPAVQQKRYTERQAVNFVIQGSAADICKAAMLRTEVALKEHNVQANLLLQIHDELLWEVPDQHEQRAADIIKRAVEATKDHWSGKFNLKVNLPVKITSGNSWGSMKAETRLT